MSNSIRAPWRVQIEDLSIPYPQKQQLLAEIEEHFQNTNEDEESFGSEALQEFTSIHNNSALLVLRKLPQPIRTLIELFFIGGPLMGLLTYLIKENFMTELFHKGGAAMYPILAIGLFLLLREALLFFRVAMLRDHTKKNLNIDSSSVLIGSLALAVIGVGATFAGIYVSIASAMANESQPHYEWVVAGVGEAISNIVLSSILVAFVLLLHYTTRKLLLRWQAPIAQ